VNIRNDLAVVDRLALLDPDRYRNLLEGYFLLLGDQQSAMEARHGLPKTYDQPKYDVMMLARIDARSTR